MSKIPALPLRTCPVCHELETREEKLVKCNECKKYTHRDCQDICGICEKKTCISSECEGFNSCGGCGYPFAFCGECSKECKKCRCYFCVKCLNSSETCEKCTLVVEREKKGVKHQYLFITSDEYDPYPTIEGEFRTEKEATKALLSKVSSYEDDIDEKTILSSLAKYGGFSDEGVRHFSIRKVVVLNTSEKKKGR